MQLTLTNFYGNLDRTSYTADVKDHTGTILYNILAFKESNSYTLRIRYYATTASPGEIIVDEQTYTSEPLSWAEIRQWAFTEVFNHYESELSVNS